MRKSSENDPTRLWHMLAAAQEIQGFLRGETRQTFADSRILQLTVEKLVQNIGEAANQLTDHFKRENDNIPWVKIIGMRHHLVHAYFKIDLDILWETATDFLPPLISQLEAIILSDDAAK